MKLIIALLLTFSVSVSGKEMIRPLTVKSITKETKLSYLVLFKEKAAIYKSTPNNLKCLSMSINEKRPVLVKWNINSLKIIDCKSKRKSP